MNFEVSKLYMKFNFFFVFLIVRRKKDVFGFDKDTDLMNIDEIVVSIIVAFKNSLIDYYWSLANAPHFHPILLLISLSLTGKEN